MTKNSFGTLYIVATPIGNLQDITLRALEILKKVHHIAAEDTRHSFSLLQHYSIKTPMISLHEHNEEQRLEQLLGYLKSGENIALISDAGTPLISDPGYFLVREARKQGVSVLSIPGACAAIAALSVSGLPTDRFIFEGFLPKKIKARQQKLDALTDERRTVVLYEAPHRILGLLKDLKRQLGPDRNITIVRELTKIFETTLTGSLEEVINQLEADKNQQKGEFVVLVEGAPKNFVHEETINPDLILKTLIEYLPLNQAVKAAVKITKCKKNDLYKRALLLSQSTIK